MRKRIKLCNANLTGVVYAIRKALSGVIPASRLSPHSCPRGKKVLRCSAYAVYCEKKSARSNQQSALCNRARGRSQEVNGNDEAGTGRSDQGSTGSPSSHIHKKCPRGRRSVER